MATLIMHNWAWSLSGLDYTPNPVFVTLLLWLHMYSLCYHGYMFLGRILFNY